MEQAHPPIRVRVSADYGAPTPVWMGGLVEDLDAMGITAPLQARLRELARLFEQGVVPMSGWVSDRDRQEYEALQDEVVAELGEELGPDYLVTKKPRAR